MEHNARREEEGFTRVIMANRTLPAWKNHTLATSLPAVKNDPRSIDSSSNSVKHPQPAKRRHLTRSRPEGPRLHLSFNLAVINLLNTITARTDL